MYREEDNGATCESITLDISPTDILSILPCHFSLPSGQHTIHRDQDRCYQVWRSAYAVQIKLEEEREIDLTDGPDIVVTKKEGTRRKNRTRAHVTVRPRSAKYGRRLPKYLQQNYVLY